MRDLSLHILDIVENAIRAGATEVRVGVAQDPDADCLEITVQDNGCGLPVSVEQAVDPFFTTKMGKRTGLGLSLLKAAAESTGGSLELVSEMGRGLFVRARLGLSHVDRLPLGDVAATLAVVACTNPEVDIACSLRVGQSAIDLKPVDGSNSNVLAASIAFGDRVREAIEDLGVVS
jgi:Histidine kinase-, DNA gyrase B-, and HSP90-like ATPase